ncbi:hypothetical protein V495_05573 [Pseudogymnoascus sp. VKM F-4514 (FW-929)]|nr:hypothetical protein V495_05573 [Pseudogymnoascus sp. VKM F-4514 (FW-929)]
MPEEQNEKAHASKSLTDHRSTFFGLPIEIRNVIYSLVLTVEDSYSYGVSHGMICLADEPGYPLKLCDIDYMHTIDSKYAGYEHTEVYLTEDYEPLKPFISRKAEAWRIEINQLNKCSPEQQEHIRNVDIIELPLDDEQPRNPEKPVVVDSRTRLEHLMTLRLGKAFRPRSLSRFKIEKRSFRRRYAELTGNGDPASKYLYNICQQNPSLRVIVRYNEWQDMRQGGYREEKSGEGGGDNELQDTVGLEWIKRMCTYHMALCREKESIAMRDEEKVILRELILSYGGAATKPSLENLRMSSSVNFLWGGIIRVGILLMRALTARFRESKVRRGVEEGEEGEL